MWTRSVKYVASVWTRLSTSESFTLLQNSISRFKKYSRICNIIVYTHLLKS